MVLGVISCKAKVSGVSREPARHQASKITAVIVTAVCHAYTTTATCHACANTDHPGSAANLAVADLAPPRQSSTDLVVPDEDACRWSLVSSSKVSSGPLRSGSIPDTAAAPLYVWTSLMSAQPGQARHNSLGTTASPVLHVSCSRCRDSRVTSV